MKVRFIPRDSKAFRIPSRSGVAWTLLAAALATILAPAAARAQAAWSPRYPATPQANLQALTWTGSQLVAVGDAGMIATASSTAATWTRQSSTSLNAVFYGVASNGMSLSVAVGAAGAIQTSSNGSSWTSRSSTTTHALYGAAWNGSVYVAVGDSGTIVTSSSGTGGWTLRSSPRTRPLNAVTSGNGVTVAVGDSGVILTSSNGTTSWTDRTSGVGTALYAVIWNGNTFVAAGVGGVVLTSPDGTTWTSHATGSGAYVSSVARGAGVWVAVGNSGTVFTSTDAATWTARTSGVTTALRSVVWAGTRFVAVGVGGEVLTSPDGTTWTRLTSAKNNLYGVGAADSVIAVGNSGSVLTSSDDNVWTPRLSGTANQLGAVTGNGTRYIAVGNGGAILSSTDAVAWAPQSSGTAERFNAVRWGGNRFVAVGNNGAIATSPDGLQWSLKTSGTTASLFSVAWTGTQYVAVGASGVILASADGDYWALRPSGTTATLYAVRSIAQDLVAVGAGGIALWSADGAEWTPVSTGTANGLYGLVWGGNRLVAVGAAGTVVTSPNGVTWDAQNSGVTTDLNAIEWSGRQYVAVGLGGVVLTSPTSSSLPAAPAVPALVSPTQGAVGVPMNTTILTWSSVVGSTYRLQISRDPAFTNLLRDDSGFTSTSRPADTLSANTVYYWRVRAKANGYSSQWSETRSFSTGALAPPALTSPSAGATGVALSPTLTWSAVSGAVSYEVQLATSSGFASPLLDDSTLTTGSRSLFGLSPNTVYYWRVRAKNGSGVSAWSATRGFTTVASPPAAPGLLTPANLASGVSVFTGFQWSAAAGATDYRIQVATDSLFTALVLHDSLLTGLTRSGTQLAGNTLHYWRVQARNPVGTGPWSSVARFTTGATPTTPPPAPALVSPAQFATGTALALDFTWGAAAGASRYQLQVSTTTNFAAPVFNDSTIAGVTRNVAGLSGSTAYYWRVRGINGIGNGAWSETWTFTTLASAPTAAPTLVSPVQFATGVALPASLSWSAVPGATSYTVEVSANAAFSGGLAFTATGVTTLSAQATGLAGLADYYWRVRGANSAGSGPYSAVQRFTTDALPLPGVPSLVAPAPFAVDVALPAAFSWGAASLAASYHLQVAASTAFATLAVNDSGLTATSRQATGSMLPSTEYYWRVRAKNATGVGDWSSPSRFTTALGVFLRPGELRVGRVGADANTLAFVLDDPARVTVRLRDVRGRTLVSVLDEVRPAGRQVIQLPPGEGAMRILEFRAGDHVTTRLLPP